MPVSLTLTVRSTNNLRLFADALNDTNSVCFDFGRFFCHQGETKIPQCSHVFHGEYIDYSRRPNPAADAEVLRSTIWLYADNRKRIVGCAAHLANTKYHSGANGLLPSRCLSVCRNCPKVQEPRSVAHDNWTLHEGST